MLKKAFRFDEETVFYFDGYDNKYLARGGALSWRLNNPGLLGTRSLPSIGYKAIGAYHQYAIFPHAIMGKNAFRAWIRLKKYFRAPLTEIAKHYQPENPESFLQRLCELTRCSSKAKPKTFSTVQLERLLQAIEELLGFSQKANESFLLLPKITAKFQCTNPKVERYLAGYDVLLTKEEAIDRVEKHQLDAVIVNRGKNDEHLRSRPGTHFTQIHFSPEEYGSDGKDFQDAMRSVGDHRTGQCIWGFINGISNTEADAVKSASHISKYAEGEKVWCLVNDSGPLSNLFDALTQKLGHRSEVVKFCTQYLRLLIEQSDQSSPKPPVVVFAHSQGALILDLALDELTAAERERIRAHTFGGAAFISPEKAHPDTRNYLSMADFIPRLASHDLATFFLRLSEGEKQGHSSDQVIEQLIQESCFDFQNQEFLKEFRAERRKHYEENIPKTKNIEIINENISGLWEHSFSVPSYQGKVEEIVRGMRKDRSNDMRGKQ